MDDDKNNKFKKTIIFSLVSLISIALHLEMGWYLFSRYSSLFITWVIASFFIFCTFISTRGSSNSDYDDCAIGALNMGLAMLLELIVLLFFIYYIFMELFS